MVERLVSTAYKEEPVGILKVSYDQAGSLPDEIRARLQLDKYERYLEIHLPSFVLSLVQTSRPQEILSHFRNSFKLVAQYLRSDDLRPRYLIGITHERLAHAAKFFGFNLMGIDSRQLDADELTRIHSGYSLTSTKRKGKPMGTVLVCYQSYESFMGRFAGSRVS